ncbi:hypothetical protein SCA6_010915 [Theobroma cacao]
MVNLEENDNEFVVGKRVKVYWSGSCRWFTGRIVAFDNKNCLHRILYEDGDKEVLDLRKERFELKVMPTDSFKLKRELCSERKVGSLDSANGEEELLSGRSNVVTNDICYVEEAGGVRQKQQQEAKTNSSKWNEQLRKGRSEFDRTEVAMSNLFVLHCKTLDRNLCYV